MRINRFVAQATGLSRRAADQAIESNRVKINGQAAMLGDVVDKQDQIMLDGHPLIATPTKTTIMLNKPPGYVCSRQGQGNPTIYDLLPKQYRHLKPVGRLDKDSSGLLLLTNDGELANRLTHPRYNKEKVYEVTLDKPLTNTDKDKIEQGIELEDGSSNLRLTTLDKSGKKWQVTMSEGRNRQIRRTFTALTYKVIELKRVRQGAYRIDQLKGALVGEVELF